MNEAQLRDTKRRANNTLLGSILIVAMELGTYVTLSNYVGDLCSKFNASVTQVVLIFTIASLVSLACNFVSAAVIGRLSAKVLTLIGTIGYIIFFICMAMGGNIAILYIGAFFFGISNTFACFTVLQPVITWWHTENLGKKIGYLSIGYCAAAMIFGFVVPRVLAALGFQTTVLLHGSITGIVMLFASLFLINNRPDTYGLKPYGYVEVAAENGGASTTVTGLGLRDCLKTLPFWGIMLAIIACNLPSSGYSSNAAMMYQSFGLDPVKAGTMISIYNAMGIVWNYAYGAVSDKIGARKANIGFATFGMLVFLIGSFLTGMPAAILVAFAFGVLQFGGMIAAVSLTPIYGTKTIGTLVALGMVASSVATSVGPIIASSMFETAGTFSLFLRVSAVILVGLILLLAVSTSKKAIDKVQALKK